MLLQYLREILGRRSLETTSPPLCPILHISVLNVFFSSLESDDGLGSTAAEKARVFYHSCLDTKSIDSAGAEPFLTLIQKVR